MSYCFCMEKKVIVFGTFDGLHDGHRHFLQEAKKMGTHLVVVVSRDAAIAHVYGKPPKNDEIDRISAVLREGIAQDVVMGHLDLKDQVFKDHNPDIVVLGFSQEDLVHELNKKATALGIAHEDIHIITPHNPEVYPPSGFDKPEIHVN